MVKSIETNSSMEKHKYLEILEKLGNLLFRRGQTIEQGFM